MTRGRRRVFFAWPVGQNLDENMTNLLLAQILQSGILRRANASGDRSKPHTSTGEERDWNHCLKKSSGSATHCRQTSSVIDVIDRVPRLGAAAAHLKEQMKNAIIDNLKYAFEHGKDRDEIANWKWPY